MKILDFGCGYKKVSTNNPDDVVVGVDVIKGIDVFHDLNKLPYPFKDDEFDYVYASHILEHLTNLIPAVNELWRITKDGGIIDIKMPHFSAWTTWVSPDHKRGCVSTTFDNWNPKHKNSNVSSFYQDVTFETLSRKLNWKGGMCCNKNILVQTFSAIANFFANLNVKFCERFWCYYVGGFGEVRIKLKVIKPQNKKTKTATITKGFKIKEQSDKD